MIKTCGYMGNSVSRSDISRYGRSLSCSDCGYLGIIPKIHSTTQSRLFNIYRSRSATKKRRVIQSSSSIYILRDLYESFSWGRV